MESVESKSAPQPIGPYSQAVKAKGMIFTAGQIGINPESNRIAEGVAEQTKQVLENLKAVLAAGGSSLDRVVKTTIYIKNMDDFAVINDVYGQYFERNKPARSTVEAARLPKDVLVEIDCIALTD
jgi:2-iminobutanoate/2-iminopropanoate deaminase